MTQVTERTERPAVRRPEAPPRAAARKTPETGGIGMAVVSFVFLFVSEHRRLFGFEEYGYRPAIIVALAAEAAATVFLAGYLGALLRRR